MKGYDYDREFNKALFKRCPECGMQLKDHTWDDLMLHYAYSIKSMIKTNHYACMFPRCKTEPL